MLAETQKHAVPWNARPRATLYELLRAVTVASNDSEGEGMSRKAFIAAIGLIAAVLAATGAISASAANDDSSANQLVVVIRRAGLLSCRRWQLKLRSLPSPRKHAAIRPIAAMGDLLLMPPPSESFERPVAPRDNSYNVARGRAFQGTACFSLPASITGLAPARANTVCERANGTSSHAHSLNTLNWEVPIYKGLGCDRLYEARRTRAPTRTDVALAETARTLLCLTSRPPFIRTVADGLGGSCRPGNRRVNQNEITARNATASIDVFNASSWALP